MEGVTILAQEAVRDFDFGVFIGMFFLITMGFFAITIVALDIDEVSGIIAVAFISIVIGLGAGLVTGHSANDPIPQYKVMISEEVSMVEFYEKYEIIDQEDLIFTVREKDQN